MRRSWALGFLVLAGCGGGPAPMSNPLTGSFAMIEGSVNDICDLIASPRYKGTRDLGSDSDRIGMALNTFVKSAEGTPLAADAALILDKFSALEKLAATRAPMDKQRVAAKELQEAVAAAKAKM